MDTILEHRLKRLMLVRLVMVTTLLMIAVYVEAVSEQLLPVNPLYFLIAATYGLTVLHALALRFLTIRRPLVHAQVIGDLLIITGLVYLTGVARAGFILLYPISVLSGSVLLYRGRGLLAALATAFYAGLLWTVRAGAVPPQGLGDILYMTPKALMYSVFVTGVACATVSLIGSYLSESLRSAGEEVADLRELNKVILDSIQSGLLMADSSGWIFYVNKVGESILGRRAGELRGRPVGEVFGSPLLDAPALEARARDRKHARLDVSYKGAGGAEAELGVSIASLAVSEPRRRGYLLVFQDLTEFRDLEREVRLKEKLAAVGEMAAQLAHEIRNPLGSISGSAQVLMAEPNMSEEQEHLLAIITRESKRLSDVLNQFLFQARSPSRPPGPVDLRPLISEAVTLLRNGPEVRPDHRVEFQADEGPHVCLAAPDRITQVFWNLVRNGLEAMPGGGVLSVRLGRMGDEIVLTVRDQGRGMDRGEQHSLFEPLRAGSQMGTGLGLAIVYGIVREHKGDITIRSVPSRGTQVEVRLPLVHVAAGESPSVKGS